MLLPAFVAAASAGAALLPPCPAVGASGGACYVNASFASGCVAVGGAVVDVANVPNCALRAPATQVLQCGGQSCTTFALGNFSAGCAAVGGFVSGALSSGGVPAACIAPKALAQFTPCPSWASTCTAPIRGDFIAGCAKLGGFLDGLLNGGVPECIADASVLAACPSGTPSCILSPTFGADCAAAGGFWGGIADGSPMCILPGAWSTFVAPADVDLGAFGAACGALGGFPGASSTCLLPDSGSKSL